MDNQDHKTRLFLVRDLMTVGVLTCSPTDTVQKLVQLMLEKGQEAVVVLDPADGNALGVVSQDSLVDVYGREGAQLMTAEEVMTEGMVQVPPDIPVEAAARVMRDQGVRAIFLTHHSGGIFYPAAILTYQHLLRHMAAVTTAELKDLGIKASRQAPLEAFFQRRDAMKKRTHPKR
jgi:CBS domain-containing protein